MATMQSMSVKDLSPREFRRNVIVRISQMWEAKNEEQHVYELGFLAVDHLGYKIEGCVPEIRMEKFKGKLKEGSVYRIEIFMVAGARRSYRTTDHPHRIKITQNTKIIEVVPEPHNFPLYAYDAKSFHDLEPRRDIPTILSDVVGLITKITELIPSKTGRGSRRHLYIKDISGRLAIVTLWDDQAENFNAEEIQQASHEENMIILLLRMYVCQFTGLLAFKGTFLTRWHINASIPEVETLQESLRDEHCVIEWVTSDTAAKEPIETTLAALAQKKDDDIGAHRYKLSIMVTQLDTPNDWWFHSCTTCCKKMVPLGNYLSCPNCHTSNENQRYKFTVSAVDIGIDPKSSDVVGHFTFFGDNGTTMTGKDVGLLIATTRGRPNYIPPALTSVVGKECVVVAEVGEQTYDADPGVLYFKVSKCELIKESATHATSSNSSNQAYQVSTDEPTDPTVNVQAQLEEDKNPETTPSKDIVDAETDTEEDMDQTTRKKRKYAGITDKMSKKISSTNKKGAVRELFPEK